MLETYTLRNHDMPEAMRVLLKEYPRDGWDAHPGFKDKTRQWLSAHQMFRKLAKRVRDDTQNYLNKDLDIDDYADRLSHFGGALIANLHGHHGWEDRIYFPELSAADPRFDTGLDVLETDHANLDVVLEDFKRTANRAIKLSHLDAAQAYEEGGRMLGVTQTIEAFLERHLGDEEDLAVPIILHHRLRG